MRFSTKGLLWRGVLAILIGVVAWPGITIGAFVLLFAVYAFLAGGAELVLMVMSRTAAGVVAVVWPGPTALVLVLVVAIWAVVGGIAEVVLAFGRSETAGQRAMLALTGLVSIASA